MTKAESEQVAEATRRLDKCRERLCGSFATGAPSELERALFLLGIAAKHLHEPAPTALNLRRAAEAIECARKLLSHLK